MEKFAEHIASVDGDVPLMLLAFFPECKLSYLRMPMVQEIISAYRALRSKLNKVRAGNVGVFCRTRSCVDKLMKGVGRNVVAL